MSARRKLPTNRLPLAACSIAAKYCFNQLESEADDEGRLNAHPGCFLAKHYAKDEVSEHEFLAWIEELRLAGALQHYKARGGWYIAITNWNIDHCINHAKRSRLPRPPLFKWPPEAPAVPEQKQLNLVVDELALRRALPPGGCG